MADSTNGHEPRRRGGIWSVLLPVLLFVVVLFLLLYFLVFNRGTPAAVSFNPSDIRWRDDAPETPDIDESGYEGSLADMMTDSYVHDGRETRITDLQIIESAYTSEIWYIQGTFVTLIDVDGQQVVSNSYYFTGVLDKGSVQQVFELMKEHPEIYGAEAMEGRLNPAIGIESTSSVWDWLWPVIYIVMIVALGYLLFRMMSRAAGANSQIMSFNKSNAKRATQSKVRFTDVAGCEEVKEELREVVEYFHSNDRYRRMGAVLPKGILLVGPPGTGKTLLAKAVAGEASVPFFSISGSDFVEMYVGVGAGRVRDLFNTAKKFAPCLVFIDEIDAVGRQRGAGLGGGNDEREQTLNQLLVELDGFEENSGVIVMAATNREDILDPALQRPGRFDRTITVDYPDKEGRKGILEVHSRNKPLAKDVDFDSVASQTVGFSGADLANVMNEAAILAVRNRRDAITMMDVEEAIDRRIAGPAKRTHMNDDDKRRVAFHEAGHAIVGLTLPDADKVQSVSIIPRGRTGGHTLMTPETDHFLYTKNMMLARISGYLGGRVSEEIFFGDVSTGASDDFEKSTKIAKSMVTEYGMSSLGPIQYSDPSQNVFLGRDYNSSRNFSEKVAYEIDTETRNIINECYRKTIEIVKSRKDDVTLIAEALIQKETITAAEINYLMEHRELPKYEEHVAPDIQDPVLAEYQPENRNNITLIDEYKRFYRQVDDIVDHGINHLVICSSSQTAGPLDSIQFKAQVTASFPDGNVGVLFITKADLNGISASIETVAQHLEKYSGCETMLVLTDEASLLNLKGMVKKTK